MLVPWLLLLPGSARRSARSDAWPLRARQEEGRQEEDGGPQADHEEGRNPQEEVAVAKGLYANIHAKRRRIKAGSNEKMRKPGSKGAPTAKAFRDSAKTAKKRKKTNRSR